MVNTALSARRKISVIFIALITALLLVYPASNTDAATTSKPKCEDVNVPVNVPGLGQAKIYGQLCLPSGRMPNTVQFLVHGATYTSRYWDWQQQASTYSYTKRALAAGYATFAVDRLGAGRSTRPAAAALMNLTTGGEALHQVIRKLRNGQITGERGFSNVIWVGHSMGSAQAWVEAEPYPADVDAYVITGFAHHIDLSKAGPLLNAFYPAAFDDKFKGKIVDPDYLTTIPGQRGIFYDTTTADPAVIQQDEILKDVTSVAELNQSIGLAAGTPPETAPSRAINVPTLIVLGATDVSLMTTCTEPDPLDCSDEIVTDEAPYYGPQADLDAVVAPGGHDVNLHPSAPGVYTQILNWIGSADF
jgi:pimeloyl-ACP methyl ester carboxylesterase